MSETNETKSIDTSIVYDYKEYPDIKDGICDNCQQAKFKSEVKSGTFIRECRNCGMKKII